MAKGKLEMMSDSVFFVYPGQPYIGEAVMHLLLAFNNEPNNEGQSSPHEREHSQIAIALTMVALESIVKIKLNEVDKIEPSKTEEVFLCTLDKYSKEHGALVLWNELKILRNQIIHSAYFERSTKGSKISTATRKRLEKSFYKDFLDRLNECTRRWRLSINPLSVSRYESLVCFMFFYWYGKETGVISNLHIYTPHVDCRMNRRNWINREDYQNLIGNGNNFIPFIAYLSGRLPEEHRIRFVRLVQETFSIDMDKKMEFAKDLLKMFKNERPNFD